MSQSLGEGFARAFEGKHYGKQQAGLYDQAIGAAGSAHGASQAALLKALGAYKEGFGNANNALQMQGALGTKLLLGREKQLLAQNQQSLRNRGLDDTTALDSSARGINTATNDSLAGLYSSLASSGAGLQMQQGQQIGQAYTNIASSEDQYAQLLASLGLGKAGGVEQGRQGGYGESIGKLIGGIVSAFSDRRLKKNIVKVDEERGISIYEFDYVDRDERWRGVMADEVEGIPGVVSECPRGYKLVNYDVLGIKMRRVA